MPTGRDLRRLVIVLHRDIGYLVAGLVLAYCVSGLALNHADIWNPDFVVHKKRIEVPPRASSAEMIPSEINALGSLVGEQRYRVFDQPTRDQVKIYYESATLHVDFGTNTALYEHIARRPFFYQVNVIHRNSFKPWRWVSDAFAVLLIVLTVTGLFVLRGAHGLSGRGKWLMVAGIVPPVVALVLHG